MKANLTVYSYVTCHKFLDLNFKKVTNLTLINYRCIFEIRKSIIIQGYVKKLTSDQSDSGDSGKILQLCCLSHQKLTKLGMK